jgi:3-oxoacyl-[acyl-carrier-protein] synthase I
MPGAPLAVLGVGLVSGVGLTGEESCAAVRCGINNFRETRFVGRGGELLVGSDVELEEPWRGATKLAKMAARAVGECFAAAHADANDIPVLLCVSEPARPGRIQGFSRLLLHDMEQDFGFRMHPHSRVIELGSVGGVVALSQARRMLAEHRYPQVIVAGVDSFLNPATLAEFDAADRLVRRGNSNGFIPGEAAGALLVTAWRQDVAAPLVLHGLGFGQEPAPLGCGRPLRADGLVQAIREALEDAAIGLKDCDHRIANVNGEHFRFKESALAVTRLLRDRKVMFSLWHTADCIGEVGAATLPAMIGVLFHGARGDYLPGPTFLGHLCNDDDKRAAFIARSTVSQTLALEAVSQTAFTLRRRTAA